MTLMWGSNSYGTCSFEGSTNTATVSKASGIGKHQLVGAVHVTYTCSVPAMCQWSFTINYSMKLTPKVSSTSSTAGFNCGLMYAGNTRDGYWAPADMGFMGYKSGSYSSGANSRMIKTLTTTKNTEVTASGTARTETFINDTNATKTFGVQFVFSAGSDAGSTYTNYYTATCSFSIASSLRTMHVVPRTDKTSAEYNKNGNVFTLFYNNGYEAVTQVTYKRNEDDEEATDVTAEVPVTADKKFTVYELGYYTIKVSMINEGWGWAALPEGAHRTVTVSIVPAGVGPPGITNTQQYTGEAVDFMLTDFDANMFKVEGVSSVDHEDDNYPIYGVTADGTIIPQEEISGNIKMFQAVKVGKYAVTLSINDNEHYHWKDGDGTGTRQVYFEIIPRELQVVFDSDYANALGKVEYTFGEYATVTVTDDSCEDETISMYFYYDDDKGNTLPAVREGKTYTVTLPPAVVGTHTLHAALNGNSDDNANYTLETNNTMTFNVTSGAIKPEFNWTYFENGKGTKDAFADNELELNYKVNTEYRVEIVIPLSHQSLIAIDETQLTAGYQDTTYSAIGSYSTKVALKSLNENIEFLNDDGTQSSTTIITFHWKISKGTFDLSGVKWEYYYVDGSGGHTADYNPNSPPEYNDDNYIYVRLKASSLPAGLTLAEDYTGERQVKVGDYTTVFDIADFVYDNTIFNDPDESAEIFTLNWKIAQKNIYKAFQKKAVTYDNENGSGTFYIQYMPVASTYEKFIKYVYSTDAAGQNEITLEQIKAEAEPMTVKTYYVTAMIDESVKGWENVTLKGTTTKSFNTGSDNAPAYATVLGEDGSETIAVVYDGNGRFGGDAISVQSEAGTKITEYTVNYYYGGVPDENQKLAEGELPTDAGEYCLEIILTGQAEERYVLTRETFTLRIDKRELFVTVDGNEDLSEKFTVIYDGKAHYGPDTISVTDGDGNAFGGYRVVIYKDSEPYEGDILNAGEYVVQISVDDGGNSVLSADGYTVVIAKKAVVVPLLTEEIIFNGEEQDASKLFDENWNSAVMELASNSVHTARNAGSYKIIFRLKEEFAGNYVFALPESDTVSLMDGGATAWLEWTVNKFVIDTAPMWKLDGKDGAVLNLPAWINLLTLGEEPALVVKTVYYDLEGNPLTNIELKGGNKFFVAAYIDQSCTEAGNFEFKNAISDELTGLTTSEQTVYTVPQSKDFTSNFMTQSFMGLPVWAWAAIALGVLLLALTLFLVLRRKRADGYDDYYDDEYDYDDDEEDEDYDDEEDEDYDDEDYEDGDYEE